RNRPRERGVEEDIRLEERTGDVVDQKTRGRQYSFQRRLVEKAERRHPIVVAWRIGREAGELIRDRRGRHSLPGGKRASRRGLEVSPRHTIHPSIVHKISDRARLPL